MSDASEILEQLAGAPGPTRDRLLKEEKADTLIEALQRAQDGHSRMVLGYVLGRRCEREAVPVLMECLDDPDPKVRSSAADALGKIGDARAGKRMFDRLVLPDPDLGVRQNLIVGLGVCEYHPAIPLLIRSLEDPDSGMRGGAAWSLKALAPPEALAALTRALAVEKSWYPREGMREALAAINERLERRLRSLKRLEKDSKESGEPGLGPMVRGVERRMRNVEERIEELRPEGSEPLEARFIPRPHLEPPERYLPTGGRHPYEPPEDAGDQELVPHPSGRGLLDRYGNRWEWSEDQYAGPHWDVHHPDGRHTNVHPDGYFHQGRDRFPEDE